MTGDDFLFDSRLIITEMSFESNVRRIRYNIVYHKTVNIKVFHICDVII